LPRIKTEEDSFESQSESICKVLFPFEHSVIIKNNNPVTQPFSREISDRIKIEQSEPKSHGLKIDHGVQTEPAA
jgi:hypothetical protein